MHFFPKSGRMQTGAEAREGYKVESESIRGKHDYLLSSDFFGRDFSAAPLGTN